MVPSSRDHWFVIPVLLFEILGGSDEHLVRFALRHESRGILHGAGPPDHPLLYHGLDHPSHRHQREAQRLEFIHRDHESLFWFQWACGRILFPIRFRIRWCVCLPMTPSVSHPWTGMCAFGIIIGACVLCLDHLGLLIPLQEIRSHTSSGLYFLAFLPCPSYPSSPTVSSSSCSVPSAFPTHYHCTATSTNSPSHPVLRSAGCSSSWPP